MSGLYQWADLQPYRIKSEVTPTTPANPTAPGALPADRSSLPGGASDGSSGGGGDYGGRDGSNSSASDNSGRTAGQVSAALGVAGALTGDRDLGRAGGLIGAGAAAANGHFGPAGAMVGGLVTRSPVGALAGGLLGRALSDDPITGKTVGRGLLAVAVPGFGLVDALTGGWASDAVFGRDASFDVKDGSINARTSGLLGAWGAETPVGSLESATARVAQATDDPLGSFAGNMASQQDARDMQAAQEGFTSSEHSEANAAGAGGDGFGGGGFGGLGGGTGVGADGNTGNAAEGGPSGPSGDAAGGDADGDGGGW